RMTASTPSGASKRSKNSSVSAGPLNIFQFPAISIQASGIAATPGSSLPSSSSSDAPPPVETHEILSASPASWTARTESPPPTTVYPSTPATASATAFVPSAKCGHSKTPIGPFQNTVSASPIAAPNRRRVSGPMSSPSQPSGTSSYGVTRLSASASNASAATTSTGSSTWNESGVSRRSSPATLAQTRTSSQRPPS